MKINIRIVPICLTLLFFINKPAWSGNAIALYEALTTCTKVTANPAEENISAKQNLLLPDMIVQSVITYQPNIPTGRGNINERLCSANLLTVNADNPIEITQMQFVLDVAADETALGTVRLFYNGTDERLNLITAEELATGTFSGGLVTFTFTKTLAEGNNVFWLCGDILETATEGAQVGAYTTSYSPDGGLESVDAPDTTYLRTVLLEHNLIFSGGDYGSAAYRIPAVASNGERIIVAADARIFDNTDLPGDIDLFSRYSDDSGNTWSEPVTIADFGDDGASDPALVYDSVSGDLLCLFASHNGLFASTPSNKIRFNVARSTDDGETWETPQEFSDEIYEPGWYAAWVASGSAQQLKNGNIVAAIGARTNSSSVLRNYMIYSSDGGLSWNTAEGEASVNGDEAKIAELEDGRLMMLIRNPGQREVVYSSDAGATWTDQEDVEDLTEPGVNGDLIRYTSLSKGDDKNRLLFSIANDPAIRKNVTVFVSYDEGDNWDTKRTICPELSAYSALTKLDDGTIGLFYENGEYEFYQLYFARFSLKWLTNGSDSLVIEDTTDAVDESKPEGTLFNVYPNPAGGNSEVHIAFQKTHPVAVDVINELGEVVTTLLPESNYTGTTNIVWHTESYARGMYFIRLTTEGQCVVRQVVLF